MFVVFLFFLKREYLSLVMIGGCGNGFFWNIGNNLMYRWYIYKLFELIYKIWLEKKNKDNICINSINYVL